MAYSENLAKLASVLTGNGDGTVSVSAAPPEADDSSKLISSAWAKLGFALQIAASGYIKLPTWMGGIIVQWGSESVSAGTYTNVVFPTVFQTACYSVTANAGLTDPTQSQYVGTGLTSVSGFSIAVNTGVGVSVSWLAIGK